MRRRAEFDLRVWGDVAISDLALISRRANIVDDARHGMYYRQVR
jgi:hypothetical protein